MKSGKVTLLGSGVVGSAAARMLARTGDFSEITIADIDAKKAGTLAGEIGDIATACKFDATDRDSIRKTIEGSSVVVNCVGPYYRFEKTILSTVIDSGIDYVDVNDDVGATYDALALDNAARDAGVRALIGMGSSPGITNLLAAYAANDLLDECESIDMYHTHGGEPSEGPGVIAHRFYCMTIDVPMFLDGKALRLTQEEAEKHVEEIEFTNLEGKHKVYPYPHPEPITLPMFLKGRGLKRVTNKGSVLPEKYYELTRLIHKCGLSSTDPVKVGDIEVIPQEFAIAYLIKRRDEILAEMNFGEQRGCVMIVCKGKKKRTLEPRTYVFSLVSEGAGKNQALGEATGYPAAFGAIMMHRGKISRTGVSPPEACVDPMTFLQLMKEALSLEGESGKGRSPLIFDSIDENGHVKRLEL